MDRVIGSQYFIMGPEVRGLEEQVAEYWDAAGRPDLQPEFFIPHVLVTYGDFWQMPRLPGRCWTASFASTCKPASAGRWNTCDAKVTWPIC